MTYQKFNFLTFILILTFLVISCSKNENNSYFSTNPEKPKAGESITIYYNADSTNLAGKSDIQAVVYSFGNKLYNVNSYSVSKQNEFLKVEVPTTDSTIGILVKFVSGKIEDTNNKKGYFIKLYNSSGEPLSNYDAALAVAYSVWGRNAGIDPDYEKALNLYNQAFSNNPSTKIKYLNNYFSVLKRVEKSKADSIISTELANLESSSNLIYENIALLANWYHRIGNTQKYELYKKKIITEFPKSEFLQNELFNKFRNEQNENKRMNLLNQFVKQFPSSKLINELYNDLVIFYRSKKEFGKAYDVFKNHAEQIHPFYFQYVAGKMIENEPDKALEIVKMGAQRGEEEFKKPDSEKEKTQTLKEWREQTGYYYGMNLFLLGKLQLKSQKIDEAIPNLKKAVILTKDFYPQQELNELYIKTLFDAGKFKVTLDEATQLIKSGNGSEKIKDYLQKAFVKVNGNKEGLTDYLAKFEESAKEELLSELKGKMIDIDAPDFTLTDLGGNKVSLSDFKGKTVVLDFWATWCGPCLKSFPGMKKAIELNKNNPNVAFLFVNTWEKVKDKKKNAADFIKNNNYPFHVLLDTENKVVTKYNVPGIPTKFVIDKNGKIRFESVGFSGKTDEMIEEINLMISLLK